MGSHFLDTGNHFLLKKEILSDKRSAVKLRDAFKIYPKAIGWSMLLSSCLIMEGYQTAVVGSCKSKFNPRVEVSCYTIAIVK
jgi:hypothetical protein